MGSLSVERDVAEKSALVTSALAGDIGAVGSWSVTSFVTVAVASPFVGVGPR